MSAKPYQHGDASYEIPCFLLVKSLCVGQIYIVVGEILGFLVPI